MSEEENQTLQDPDISTEDANNETEVIPEPTETQDLPSPVEMEATTENTEGVPETGTEAAPEPIVETEDVAEHIVETEDVTEHIVETEDVIEHIVETEDVTEHIGETEDVTEPIVETEDVPEFTETKVVPEFTETVDVPEPTVEMEAATDTTETEEIPEPTIETEEIPEPTIETEEIPEPTIETEADGIVEDVIDDKKVVSLPKEVQREVQAAAEGDYIMPQVLEVFVKPNDGGDEVLINVEIDHSSKTELPYMGGFISRKTGCVYHHALTQTATSPDPKSKIPKSHRDAQTFQAEIVSVQTSREFATQTIEAKPGLYFEEVGEVLSPREYFSSADLAVLQLEKAVIIQSHARGMFARIRSRNKRQELADKISFDKEEAERKSIEADLLHKREIERRIKPRTIEDFKILQAELEAWRLNETANVNAKSMSKEAKALALEEILHKETKLLQTIDKLKITAHKHSKEAKVSKLLEAMSRPKVWAQRDGQTTSVHTPYTTRAKELKELYNGLQLLLLTTDERLDVLLHVKWTVKEFHCPLTREIIDLIDREADMLNRGRPKNTLAGLRKRLANLFLEFIKTPEFNPESAKYQKVAKNTEIEIGDNTNAKFSISTST